MKLLHLGDLHLGKNLNEFDLIEDQQYILQQIVDLALEQKVDGIIMAGDIYDKAVPSERAVNLLDWFLNLLAQKQIMVFAISGNHDSDERLNFGSSFMAAQGIYMVSRYDGNLFCKVLDTEQGPVNIYLLPFVKAAQIRKIFPQEEINSYEDAVRTVLEKANINPQEKNILVAHQFVAGSNMQGPECSGSEGAGVDNVGLVDQIGVNIFADFDYVALGHIHGPQQIGRPEVRYSGSLLKYSVKEANNQKSVPLITLDEGDIKVELLPLRPKRDLRHIRGKMEDLLKKENIQDSDDYMYITLTDEEPINDAMNIVQQYYPRTVTLEYDNSHTRGVDKIDDAPLQRAESFDTIVQDFYKQIYGLEISEEELVIMKQLAGEVGLDNETN